MANQNPGYCLFRDSQGFDLTKLPPPYNSWDRTSVNPDTFSALNQSRSKSTLHRYTIEALLEWCKGKDSKIGVVKMAHENYVSQWTLDDGTVLVSNSIGSGILSAGRRDPLTGRVSSIQPLGVSTTVFNAASILMNYMFIQADRASAAGSTDGIITWNLLNEIRDYFSTNGVMPEVPTRLVCDDLYWALSYGHIPVSISKGNIALFSEKRLSSKEFASGSVILGKPDLLINSGNAPGKSGASTGIQTVKDAKAFAAEYTKNLHWTPEEEMLIPQYDDGTEVPPEVMTILTRFIKSRDWASPMNNPCWRGITAYGKSTGVKILACILHTPLVWMTCATTTELEDFLSKHVPNTEAQLGQDPVDLPTFEEMEFDPVLSYYRLTGENKDDATEDDCKSAYAQLALGKAAQKTNPFKIVESDFVKALVNGWIVEVQEFSRIRDSGTLVGLNNYNEPDSVIPLVDGRHVRRHRNALVVWTDNVGYTSCRKVDGSVLRRMSFIIDSYEMPRERALRRIQKNTKCSDTSLLERMYDVWCKVAAFCKERDITDEGTVSLTELENWVYLVLLDGKETIADSCREALVSKLSSDPDTQNEIMDSCVSLALSTAGLA